MSVTVSHRPIPRLPGEEGMARETRALPGRWQRGLGAAGGGARPGGLPVWLGRCLTVRSLGCPARWGWPERLEPYRGGGSGAWGPLAEALGREAYQFGRDGVSPSDPWATRRGGGDGWRAGCEKNPPVRFGGRGGRQRPSLPLLRRSSGGLRWPKTQLATKEPVEPLPLEKWVDPHR